MLLFRVQRYALFPNRARKNLKISTKYPKKYPMRFPERLPGLPERYPTKQRIPKAYVRCFVPISKKKPQISWRLYEANRRKEHEICGFSTNEMT